MVGYKNLRVGCDISEFPEQGIIRPYIYNYLIDHNISIHALRGMDSIYITKQGICFKLYGPGLAYQERLIPPVNGKRFNNPAGVALAPYVFILDDVDEATIFIVEGVADAVAIYQHGYRAVALLGAEVPEERIQTLETLIALATPSKVYFIPDNDRPGLEVINKLLPYFPFKVCFLPGFKKDICELTFDEQKLLLDYHSKFGT